MYSADPASCHLIKRFEQPAFAFPPGLAPEVIMEKTHAISLGNFGKENPVELHQIPFPEGIWEPGGIASRTVIIHIIEI